MGLRTVVAAEAAGIHHSVSSLRYLTDNFRPILETDMEQLMAGILS